MNQKPPLGDFIEWIKRFWVPIAGFIGAATSVGVFIELWIGNQTIYNWVTAVLGFLVLLSALLWVGFSKVDNTDRLLLVSTDKTLYPRYPSLYKLAQFGLVMLLFLTLGAGDFLYRKSKESDQKVIVLVTNFEGVDPQKYRVTETIWESLSSALQDCDDVELILLKDISIKSLDEAKTEGDKYNATIVIWGWYGITNEVVRFSAHFDVLRQPSMVPNSFKDQKPIKDFGIAEFQSFVLQDTLSAEMTYLSLTTVGLVRYSLQDWNGAVSSFNSALAYTSDEKNIQKIKYYIDLTYKTQVTALPPDLVAIFVISRNISQGEQITESDLSTITIRKEDLVSEMYTLDEKEKLLNDQTVKYPIDQGVAITESMVSNGVLDIPISGPQWASLIPAGQTAISIPANRIELSETIGTVQIDNLACHETASNSSAIVYSFEENEEISIIDNNIDTDNDISWLLVKTNNLDKSCWVDGSYIDFSNTNIVIP